MIKEKPFLLLGFYISGIVNAIFFLSVSNFDLQAKNPNEIPKSCTEIKYSMVAMVTNRLRVIGFHLYVIKGEKSSVCLF